MEKEKRKKMYMPKSVPEKKYVIKGFTSNAFTIIIICLAIGIFFGIIRFIQTNNVIWAFGPALIFGGVPTLLLVEDRHCESFLDWIKQFIRYSQEQKRYEYRKYNIYERKYQDEVEKYE